MLTNLYKIKASAKKLFIELKKGYSVDTTALTNAHTSACIALCALIAEDAYSEPKCLDHPKKKIEKSRYSDRTTKMQSACGLRGGHLLGVVAEQDIMEELHLIGSGYRDAFEQSGDDIEKSLTNTTGAELSDGIAPPTPCESVFSIRSTQSKDGYFCTIKDFKP